MLTAVVNLSWSVTPIVKRVGADLRAKLLQLGDPRQEDDVACYLEEMEEQLVTGTPYGACYQVLEALARYYDITGPDRVETVGVVLCAHFRTVYPVAPDGFERVGRMRNKDDEDEGRTPPRDVPEIQESTEEAAAPEASDGSSSQDHPSGETRSDADVPRPSEG